MLELPALPRKVLLCDELGGEDVSCLQTDEALTLRIRGGKKRSLHSMVRLTLAEGPEIALIKVDQEAPQKQHGSLVDPMAERKK